MKVKLRRDRREKAQFMEEAMPHMASLYRFSVNRTRDPILAEDLVQETYTEAWQSFHLYTPDSNCKAWLFRILLRVWAKHLRDTNRLTPEVDIENIPERKLAVEPDFQQAPERQEVLKILQSLPHSYRMVLILVDVEEFSYRETAQMMELPIGSVMSRLHRARALFRKKFLQES
ncbi:sigma-70 family RNA polymerase sigma factor [Acidobacteria bacterium AH-259-D05]|nr:sigma-70 family RNA polymerase sigma factor [Acidobacteria bacterium AH-259-D05]